MAAIQYNPHIVGEDSVVEAVSKVDMSHLSGATMADLIMEPPIHLVTASPTKSKRSSASQLRSNRTSTISTASTTKSALRHSNHLLIEMLQNIQTELSAHRTIMLDIQHRVSHLEHESNASVTNEPAQLAALQALEGQTPKRNSRLIPPEGQQWWNACQNFARNSDPPLSAAEFLRTPKRFSGIEWQYGGPPSAKPQTPPMTPPEDELPPLTPTSGEEDEDSSDVEEDMTPRPDITLDLSELRSSTPIEEIADEEGDTIVESTVEIDKKKLPLPPTLQPPPGGKPISVSSVEDVTAIDPEPVLEPMELVNKFRYYKGVKSLRTYQALMKNKNTDKESVVLIHFHKASDLRGLED